MIQLATHSMVLLLALLLLAAGGCGALGDLGLAKPTASVVGAELKDISLQAATMLFDVKVDNPYSADLPLTDVAYSLTSQGIKFLSGKADLHGSIPAAASKVLPIPVEIDFMELLAALQNVRPGSVVPYDANLNLSVNTLAGPLSLPLRRSGEIAIPSLQSLGLP